MAFSTIKSTSSLLTLSVNCLRLKHLGCGSVSFQRSALLGAQVFGLETASRGCHTRAAQLAHTDDRNVRAVGQPPPAYKFSERQQEDEILMGITIYEHGIALELMKHIEGLNKKLVKNSHIELMCRILFPMLDSEGSEAVRKEVLESKGLQVLDKLIRHNCRTMHADQLVSSFKLFAKLGVPTSHEACQMVMRLLSKHLNTMPLTTMTYLNMLLDKEVKPEHSSPLCKALSIALRSAFQCQLDLQLERNNVPQLILFLRYASTAQCSDETITTLAKCLLERKHEIEARGVVKIMMSLTVCNPDMEELPRLVEEFFPILTRNIRHIRVETLYNLFKMLSTKVYLGYPLYCNQEFNHAFIKKILFSRKPALVLEVLKPLSIMNHVDIDLLETCADLIVSDPSVLTRNESLYLSFVRYLATAVHKPRCWDALEPILNHHDSTYEKIGQQDIALAQHLLSINVLPLKRIQRLFSEENLPILQEWSERSGTCSLVTIYNSIKYLHPTYNGPLPPQSLVQTWYEAKEAEKLNIHFRIYTLQGALEYFCGGESYVANGLFHDGISIDHCLLMRGGSPVEFSDPAPLYLKDIKVPEGATLVLIKALSPSNYVSNTRRLMEIATLELRFLQSLGHSVVDVSLPVWTELMEGERIPYLQQRIKESLASSPVPKTPSLSVWTGLDAERIPRLQQPGQQSNRGLPPSLSETPVYTLRPTPKQGK